ncbi:MAG: hypothetical protein A3J46_00745 [Candidatus Yanofskybacteria bacterium RIFCSPHIGHO2_02_FULL_41_11]|uniref:DUF5667 domain-containing protein n=1 Tax=Candidatus Yanofskybacteria bacterium RIFCSPHIGHO2_02_FULL_41_11 TaxID=1802675 RepID=A0A1F8FBL3_9BACT|nr:MAG: hypothetical protein A3J46_00745 [Candidatus Yanofskybacteria bacterium RIFCSPHIGHO2_02_FULL_41_11]
MRKLSVILVSVLMIACSSFGLSNKTPIVLSDDEQKTVQRLQGFKNNINQTFEGSPNETAIYTQALIVADGDIEKVKRARILVKQVYDGDPINIARYTLAVILMEK